MKIYMNRALSAAAMVALLFSLVTPAMTVAQQPQDPFIKIETLNGAAYNNQCVSEITSISGSGLTGNQGNTFALEIGWGDGSASTTISGLEGKNTPFTFNELHTPNGPSTGVTLFLYHVQDSGKDGVYEFAEQCTPTTGTLTVIKEVIGSDAPADDFSFQVNGGSEIAFEADGQNDLSLESETYTVTEVVVDNYDVSYEGCENINLSAGGEAICTITNTYNPAPTKGTLTVKKDVVDSDGVTDVTDDQTFTVTLDGTNSTSFSEESDAVYADLAPGTYTLAELADPNYTYVSGAGSVTVKAGENTVVTIVNKQNEVAVPTGSITVCKIVLDAEGNVITGAEGTTFTISGLTPDPETAQGAPHGILPNSIFNTPLVLNQKILAASEGNDAECKIYDGLTLDTVGNTGGYYYGQEQIESALEWLTPKYTDQYNESVLDLSDFLAYDSALFDENPENDAGRNQNADGHVTLSTQRPDRTLVVLNQLKSAPVCDAEATQIIVSDTLTFENGDAAVAVSLPINEAWTADISGATWIWGENPISDSIATTSQTFTRTFDIIGTPTGATLNIAADNTYSVSINGNLVGTDLSEKNYNLAGQDVYVIPAEDLVSGENTITFTVTNIGLPGSEPLDNPAGLLYKLVVTNNECEVPPPAPACSDGEDNDLDGKTDEEDPGCMTDGEYNPEDDDETDPTTPPTDVCSNIDGVQETVPSGYVANDGVCEEQRSSGGGGSRRGSVLGASTGEVLGASCGLYMDRYLKLGAPTNDEVQVIKLQAFLNTEGLFNRVPTGVYDMRTHNAVKDFQEKYFADILTPWGLTGPTGLVYLTTLNKINMIECPELMLQVPVLTPWTSTTNTKFAQ